MLSQSIYVCTRSFPIQETYLGNDLFVYVERTNRKFRLRGIFLKGNENLPSPVQLIMRPTHNQQSGEDVYKNPAHPGRHHVGLRRPEVNV